jgi:glycosyltransferase involved in cell wall biosynthesis
LVLSTTPKAILLGSIACWVCSAERRVVFFQGRVYENYTGIKRKFFRSLDRLTIMLSTNTLFVSNSLLSAYRDEGLIGERAGHVVGNGSVGGVDIETFSPERFGSDELGALRRALNVPASSLVAVTVGRICEDKGLREIISLSQTLSAEPVIFVVVGTVDPGSIELGNALLTMNNVRHVPFCPNVAMYFAMSDMHLFLSAREGFGNVAIEAASMGVPTIAFDVVGIKDSVAEGVTGIRLPYGKVCLIEDIIREAIKDREAFRRRFPDTRNWVATRYAQMQVWIDYLAYFECITKSKMKHTVVS